MKCYCRYCPKKFIMYMKGRVLINKDIAGKYHFFLIDAPIMETLQLQLYKRYLYGLTAKTAECKCNINKKPCLVAVREKAH